MRACLHLYTKTSQDSVFYQMLNEDIVLKENEIFEYSDHYYQMLDSEAKKDFDRSGLKNEKYQVISTRTEPNEYWGDIRYLFLKPLE